MHHRPHIWPKRIREALQPEQDLSTGLIGPLVAATDSNGPAGVVLEDHYFNKRSNGGDYNIVY